MRHCGSPLYRGAAIRAESPIVSADTHPLRCRYHDTIVSIDSSPLGRALPSDLLILYVGMILLNSLLCCLSSNVIKGKVFLKVCKFLLFWFQSWFYDIVKWLMHYKERSLLRKKLKDSHICTVYILSFSHFDVVRSTFCAFSEVGSQANLFPESI